MGWCEFMDDNHIVVGYRWMLKLRKLRIPRWFVGLVTTAVALMALVVLQVGTTIKTGSSPVAEDGIRWERLSFE
ncbi:hypothetical protein HanIR_Chr16g0813861 [Helianthus annuus]|nr:hypothetical protein HanIR_Chr16g0813861 [Helianthus annuus]